MKTGSEEELFQREEGRLDAFFRKSRAGTRSELVAGAPTSSVCHHVTLQPRRC